MQTSEKQKKFLAQSYIDAYKDYKFLCETRSKTGWDYIILTAANTHQAKAYQVQIEKRKKEKRLPFGTEFLVIPDYRDDRIGSGGATLNVLRVISQKIGLKNISQKKILIVHSGGDSKRIPQYSVCGKIFSTVPREIKNGTISTIFDELLITVSGIPDRIGSGILILPSDTEIILNPLQLDLKSCDAAALSMKASAREGTEHGVFLQDSENNEQGRHIVSRFLHKQPEHTLRDYKAVDRNGDVDIDTGCIFLGNKTVRSLVELISSNDEMDMQKFYQFVNPKVCLNFYADFIYPLAKDSSLEEYLEETPENGYSEELTECRKLIWEKLHPFHILLIRLIPAKYIHFGMTSELYNLFIWQLENYDYLGWKKRLITNAKTGRVYNSKVDKMSEIPENAFIENSIIGPNVKIGNGVILSGIEVTNLDIPDNMVLHGVKLSDGSFVCRIYGREDNPKSSYNASFLNGTIENLIRITQSKKEEIFGDGTASLWDAKIYPAATSFEDAVQKSMVIFKILNNTASSDEIRQWKSSKKHSLRSSFQDSDIEWIITWQEKVQYSVCLETLIEQVLAGNEIKKELKILEVLDKEALRQLMKDITNQSEKEKFPNNMRLFLLAGEICKKFDIADDEINYEFLENKAYQKISDVIEAETLCRFTTLYGQHKFTLEQDEVSLPVRVNFCGSPSDAAPYCLEHGGTMLDGTLLLRGAYPIKVTAKRLENPEICLASKDLQMEQRFTRIDDIRNCGNPFDSFALHKAVLLATGYIPLTDKNVSMETFYENFGGGLYLETCVDVPKGSGLGTSSIIAAAMVKALHHMVGVEASHEKIYSQVFLAEQLMTTGGGWQDQVGGLTPGIKYFISQPGTYQSISVENLDLSDSTKKELNDRFALIFSGQRRLARNILREEMNQCIRNDRAALDAIKRIQECCAIMRFYLQKGEITEFAHYISEQFELVKILDKGASNTCIDYIFDVCDDLIDGKSICGAGGGGFLQVILKKDVTKDDLKKRITETFSDCGVEVWDCELLYE